jgi:prophage antirepressor-like protein
MSHLILFEFNGQEIRVQVDDDGNLWWVVQDVCVALTLKNVSEGDLGSTEEG